MEETPFLGDYRATMWCVSGRFTCSGDDVAFLFKVAFLSEMVPFVCMYVLCAVRRLVLRWER